MSDTPPRQITNREAKARARVACAIDGIHPRTHSRPTFAFLSTAFGFGPVSKAVTIARALLAADPDVELHYFGDGIDRDFAVAAGVFHDVVRLSPDDPDQLRALIPHLCEYDSVVSVLNLDIAPHWSEDAPPLYLVDSLAWMWRRVPPGIEHVSRYFVQDYLMQPARVSHWVQQTPLELIAPVDAAAVGHVCGVASAREDRLLVNLSGCASPLATNGHYEQYASVLSEALVREAAEEFASIVIACNAQIAERLRRHLRPNEHVTVEHYAPDAFLTLLASSRVVLSATGITTTIEAIGLGAPIRFLLPQNYSQALISEHYRSLLGDSTTMALSRFGPQFAVDPDLDESDGMARTVQSVRAILATRRSELNEALADVLRSRDDHVTGVLRAQRLRDWDRPGQEQIAARVLYDVVGVRRAT